MELQIFKKNKNGNYTLWIRSKSPMNYASQNDAYYDRFSGVRIERGCIVITHVRENSGVVNDGMILTARYRFQDGSFHLIGVTHVRSESCRSKGEGAIVATVTTDINFSNGKGIQDFKYEGCWDWLKPVKLPKPKSVTFNLDDCVAESWGESGHSSPVTATDLKQLTFKNYRYGQIHLTVNDEFLSF